jgi:hypothetical protein
LENKLKGKRGSKSKNKFIDNDEFYDLIMKFQDEVITKKEKTRLGEIVLSLVNHFAMKPNFSNYTYLDEMKSNAFYTIWKGLKKFNREKGNNVFSYYTQTCYHAFIFIINKEKMIAERKLEYISERKEVFESNSEVARYAKKKFTSEIKNNKMDY